MTDEVAEVAGGGMLSCRSHGSGGLQERLAALVIAGGRRGTVRDGREGNRTVPGMFWAVTVDGRAVAVIETVTVGRRRFCEIGAGFAAMQGEGDGSRALRWVAHRDCLRRAGGFGPEMGLWCEAVRLVAVPDRDLEAAAVFPATRG